MNTYRAVLFDLDGTLLDSLLDFHHIIDHMLRQRGHASLDPLALRLHVSQGARAMISAAFQLPAEDAETDRLLEEFLTLYGQNPARHSRLFDGIETILSWLEAHTLPWGIVTNKPEHFSRPILTALGLAERCACLICPEQVTHTKPDPESLLLACNELHRTPAETLYVGDHRRDIEAGQRAGMRTIACGYGYIPAQEDPAHWHSTHLIRDTQELARLLESLYLESRT